MELREKIGEGSFGEVWLAQDLSRNEKVAIKFLRFDRKTKNFAEAIVLFKREFELLGELRHLHLARVIDFGFDSDREQYFFSEEFCPGKTLREALRGKSLDYFEEILVQVLSALDYIHSQGVIHLDIKPENILIEEREDRPFAKLMDFGVAARLKSLPQGVGGSPAYMAPELLGPSPRPEPRADLYSLGVLCLEALTGKLPFDPNSPQSAMEWHRRGDIPDNFWKIREHPPYFRELVEKLLAKKPSDRFSNARVVLNFLNLATSGKYQKVEEELQVEIPVEGPLVERKEEVLEEIQQRIQNIFFSPSGSPSSPLVFICGERGIGKSRILEELRQFIALKEIPCIKITCDWEIPAWPRLAEALALPPLAQDELDEKWQMRRRIDSILESARQKPFCLLIDDFHKADSDLRETLLHLTETTRREGSENPGSLFFIAVATEEEIEEGVFLKRLSAQGTLQYVKRVLGQNSRIEELGNLLFKYSGGLPLLMVEGLRYAAPHFYRGEDFENLLSSPQISLLYREKIQSLSAAEEELLYLVALLFRPVQEGELLSILDLSPAELVQLSKNCLKKGVLCNPQQVLSEETISVTFQMNSQALALDLIDRLSPETRKTLHEKIAQGLMKSEIAPLEEIAYHLSKAGLSELAAQFYENAGMAFKDQGQISSAVKCLGKAIPFLTEGSSPWQNLLLETIRLLVLAGAYSEAEKHLQKLDNYTSWQSEELKGWLCFKRREFSKSKEHYQKAVQDLSGENVFQKILIENSLANIDLQESRPAEAVSRFEKTLQWESSLSAEERVKIHNNNLGIARAVLGEKERSIQFYQDRMKDLEGRMTPGEEIALLNGRGFACLQAGHYQEAVSGLKRAMQLAEQSGAMHSLSSIMGNLITALLKESRYAESLPLLQKIVSFQQRLGNPRDVSYNLLRQGSVFLTLGMAEAAKKCFQSGKTFVHSDQNLSAWYLLVQGYWERENGDLNLAKNFFDQLEQEAKKIGNVDIEAWAIYAKADLAYEQKNISECRLLLSKIPESIQDMEFLARLHLLKAKVSATEKHKEDPEGLFSSVEKECLQGHFREILWELYHDWGLIRKKNQGDTAAAGLFQQGVQIVESIVSSLPEEYRDRYLNQKFRKKLFQDWENSKTPHSRGISSRIRDFFKEKTGTVKGP